MKVMQRNRLTSASSWNNQQLQKLIHITSSIQLHFAGMLVVPVTHLQCHCTDLWFTAQLLSLWGTSSYDSRFSCFSFRPLHLVFLSSENAGNSLLSFKLLSLKLFIVCKSLESSISHSSFRVFFCSLSFLSSSLTAFVSSLFLIIVMIRGVGWIHHYNCRKITATWIRDSLF